MSQAGRKGGTWELPKRIVLMCYELTHDFPKHDSDYSEETFIHHSRIGFRKLLFSKDLSPAKVNDFPSSESSKDYFQGYDRQKKIKKHLISPIDNKRIPGKKTQEIVFLLNERGEKKGNDLLARIKQAVITIRDRGEMTIGEIIKALNKPY